MKVEPVIEAIVRAHKVDHATAVRLYDSIPEDYREDVARHIVRQRITIEAVIATVKLNRAQAKKQAVKDWSVILAVIFLVAGWCLI